MYIILPKELQKILLTAFSVSLEITFDMVINIVSLNATEYILFYFEKLQYHYKVTYWGFYLILSVTLKDYISRYAIASRYQKYFKRFERKRIVLIPYIFYADIKIYVIKRRY